MVAGYIAMARKMTPGDQAEFWRTLSPANLGVRRYVRRFRALLARHAPEVMDADVEHCRLAVEVHLRSAIAEAISKVASPKDRPLVEAQQWAALARKYPRACSMGEACRLICKRMDAEPLLGVRH